MIKNYNKQYLTDIVNYSFTVLDSVKCNNTRWHIVFNIYNEQIHYRTRENQILRTIGIKDFSYDCSFPQKIISKNGTLKNGNEDFKDYSPELNRELIYPVYSKVREFSNWTIEQREKIIHHPEIMNCKY